MREISILKSKLTKPQILGSILFTGLIAGYFAFSYPVSAQSPTLRETGDDARTPVTSPRPTPSDIDVSGPTTGINLTVSPVFLSLTTDPGVPVATSIKVRNNSNVNENLRINLAKFVPVETGNPVISDIGEGDAFAKWIDFSDPEFTLLPNETKTIKVTISPPKEASLGYYYALVINRVREGQAGDRQNVIAGAPALPVLLEVRSPNAKREVQLVELKTDSFFYEYLPTKFTVTMKNSGNVHIAPIGDIFIDWGSLQDVAVIPVNSGKGNLLPNSRRNFEASWSDGFAVRTPKLENGKEVTNDKGELVYTTNYDFTKANKFRIGKYTANLLMIYDNGERDIPVEATVSFWVIPWKILLGALVIGIFALLGLKNALMNNIRRFKGLFGK